MQSETTINKMSMPELNTSMKLRSTASAIYHVLIEEYISSGYYSSGAVSTSFLAKSINEKRNFAMAAGLKELESAGLIQKQTCRSKSYILTAPVRKYLIESHSLSDKWLANGIAKSFSPKGKNGEITKVFACCS